MDPADSSSAVPSSDAATTLSLLSRLRTEIPEVFEQAQVVGRWVWLEFHTPPLRTIREKLKELGFHWNHNRRCWQHPCGVHRRHSSSDPRDKYEVQPATELTVRDALAPADGTLSAKEYKVVALRECPLPETLALCDSPARAAEYWRLHVQSNPYFNPECECFAILFLNTRHRVKGHQLVTIGTMDSILVHPREVFRAAVVCAAYAIVLMHNHPSGEPSPSEADVKVTRDLIRAGQLMHIAVADHVIMGNPTHCSLREQGLFGQ